jgi:hypothetical protein
MPAKQSNGFHLSPRFGATLAKTAMNADIILAVNFSEYASIFTARQLAGSLYRLTVPEDRILRSNRC